MSLDGNRLGSAVAAAVSAAGITAGTPITPSQLEDIWQRVFREDVIEYQGNAVVNVASVTAVTPGVGISGPGTGTLS